MKLLLDEMYTPLIAATLRERGFDAVSVHDMGTAGSTDHHVLTLARAGGRVLCTENVGDFVPLLRALGAEDQTHCGVIFTSHRRFPRSAATVRPIVDALAALHTDNPANDSLAGLVIWL